MKKLLIYTRQTISEEEYSAKLANSMHIALIDDNGNIIVLNHNSGVFFALATENEDGSLNAKSLIKPVAVKCEDGGYFIYATRTEPDGSFEEASKDMMLVAYTKDFISFEEKGILPVSEEYRLLTLTQPSGLPLDLPEGAIPSCVLDIEDSLFETLKNKLLTPENIAVVLPENIRVSSFEELKNIGAVAHYSDGSTAKKLVDWDNTIDFSKKGVVKATGTVHQDHYEFPLCIDRADPCVARYKGKYYFIATNDADKNHTLYIRTADTIKGLFEAEEVLLLDSDTYEGIANLLWAPEFHEIDGRLYIFHAATSGEFFCEESRVMALKENGDPMNRNDWSAPMKVVKADGTDICEEGKTITLDMTTFLWEGDYYAVWSQRQFIPVDLGAWLYIAKLNRQKPWMLASEPQVLSKPVYGWANNHTFVDEGPFALIKDDKLYLTYSSALVDSTYVVSMLSTQKGVDILDKNNWKKGNFPILTARSTPGEYGTGHNAYVEDENGDIWNAYHARPGVDGPRSTGIRRVHFGKDGEPILDMHEEQDVNPSLKKVEVTIEVC